MWLSFHSCNKIQIPVPSIIKTILITFALRTGWTSQQNVLFDKVLKIVSSYRLARLTYEGVSTRKVL